MSKELEDITTHHKYYQKVYFEGLLNLLKDKNTGEECINTIKSELFFESRRLEDYKEKLSPKEYLDHKFMLDEQKVIVYRLRELVSNYTKANINNDQIEPISLDYGSKNSDAIKLLHKLLYPAFIELEFDEFSLHFTMGNKDFVPIKWKGVEPAVVDLFSKKLKLLHTHWSKPILQHFRSKKGELFQKKQLVSVASERANGSYTGYTVIKEIGEKLEDL